MASAQRNCGLRIADCGLCNPKSKIQNPQLGCRGQSTLEYLLMAVAVLLAVLFGVRSVIQGKTEARMNDAGSAINKAGQELKNAIGFH